MNNRSIAALSAILLASTASLALGCMGEVDDTIADEMTADEMTAEAEQAIGGGSCTPTDPQRTTTSGPKTYFNFAASDANANDAKAFCAAIGGQLATPMSSAENGAVKSLLVDQRTFLGPRQLSGQAVTSAGWVMPNGVPLSYSAFSSGEPNDSDGIEDGYQDCSAMNQSDGSWDDVSCTNTQGYDWVCEFGGPPPIHCGGGSTCAIPPGGSTYGCQCPAGSRFDPNINACRPN
ncbi:lectin-like protein [Polyangium sp. 6x1]|uniref:lectin-like protein n=1 Tax=Polyangium sp. 6x1 TaxID=3042689 RepID=UPI002482D8D0|nr:lectin-like protein [Polyangium sp. 6x1]MDI1442446.1 lectin-like protein [Polyangium sp. 6x1]